MNKINELFPRASKDFLDLNLQNPIPEPAASNALGAETEGKGTSTERVTVRITSYRTRLLDLDNAFGGQKLLLDCITELRLIRGDDPEAIELIVRQKKVEHRTSEKTLIEIW
jgi:Holliday junction resolvase RusA-like endonuclease